MSRSTREKPDLSQASLEEALRPSGSLLGTNAALSCAIQARAVAATDWDSTTLDLLVRLRLAPERSLRGVDLVRQLELSPSHVSRVLDRMERQGEDVPQQGNMVGLAVLQALPGRQQPL